jgi:hypothetical protein
MKLIAWVLGRWSYRQQMMRYRQGLDYASQKDHKAALEQYSAAIDLVGAPADIRAMALYNRAVIHSAMHDDAKAIHDLEELLASPGAAASVRLEAKRKLVRIERAASRPEHNERSGD